MTRWWLWMVAGLVSAIGGILAIANPLAATIAVEQLVGWLFLAVGVLQFFGSWREPDFGARIWALLIGLATIFVGISMLVHPLAGVISLTLLVALAFLFGGFIRLISAYYLRRTAVFWPMFFAGLVTVGLAFFILMNLPEAALGLLGILLAIELLSTGVSLIAFALVKRSMIP